MNIDRLISSAVPTLVPSDTGNKALLLMEENNLTQLPLIAEDKYMALVTESNVLDWEEPSLQLGRAGFLNYRPAINAGKHPFDALKLANQQNLSVLPVINNDDVYLGAITSNNLIKYFAENSGLDNPGSIIVLEILPHNYSLVEIARICESENVIIISTQMFTNTQTGNMEITLKLNRTEIDAVIASFERHEYNILEVYGNQSGTEDLQDRYGLLMNYINM